MPIEHGRYLAEQIPGAKLIELPGFEPSLIWEDQQLAVDHLEESLTDIRHGPEPTRILAAVLFTDIVGSTEQAGRLGDRRWRELLNVHDELAGAWSRRRAAASSRPPETASSPPSTAPGEGSTAPPPS
jgi:hypothetical protein